MALLEEAHVGVVQGTLDGRAHFRASTATSDALLEEGCKRHFPFLPKPHLKRRTDYGVVRGLRPMPRQPMPRAVRCLLPLARDPRRLTGWRRDVAPVDPTPRTRGGTRIGPMPRLPNHGP